MRSHETELFEGEASQIPTSSTWQPNRRDLFQIIPRYFTLNPLISPQKCQGLTITSYSIHTVKNSGQFSMNGRDVSMIKDTLGH